MQCTGTHTQLSVLTGSLDELRARRFTGFEEEDMRNFTALALLALAGCASHTEVIKLGSDRYMVGFHQKGGFDSWTEVKANGIKLADDFCKQRDQSLEVLDTKTSGVRGWSPLNVEVTFTCRTAP